MLNITLHFGEEILIRCYYVVQDVLGEVCVNDVEVIPDVTCDKDWFAHKVLHCLFICSWKINDSEKH